MREHEQIFGQAPRRKSWPAPGLHPKTPLPASSWVPASSAHAWLVSCKPYKQPGSPGSTIPASGEQLMVNRCGCVLLGDISLASPPKFKRSFALERFSDALQAPRLSPPLPAPRKGGKSAASGLFPPLPRGDAGEFFECLRVAPGSASRRWKTALGRGRGAL